MKTGKTGEAETRRRSKGDGCHVREQQHAFRDAERKGRRFGRPVSDKHFEHDLRGRGNGCGLCGGCGCRQGHERSSAIHGRDDRLACGRRICNRFAHRPYVDRLSVWADAGLGIGLHYVRHDARCRRSFVGESFRLRTFLIRGEPFIAHAFVRALMRTAPCWKSFQLGPRARETRATSWA